MIRAYILNNQTLTPKILEANSPIPENTLWIDIEEPTEDEHDWMQHLFKEEVPEEDDIDEIESSSRYYTDTDGIHITCLFTRRKGRDTEATNVQFTLHGNMLITFRESDVSIIRILRHYLKHDILEEPLRTNIDIFLEIQNILIDSLSDDIEDSYTTLEQSSDNILSDEDSKIKELLEVLKFQENTISQIRQNLFDARNAVRYLRKSTFSRLNPTQISTIDRVLNDIESILPHTQFIFDKINFQLQTAMSYTNHTQNKIIKIFSVAAVVFMPPTLIASVYGMNFNIMPELQWKYGYLFAIILMFLSALLTYIVFKYKKWL